MNGSFSPKYSQWRDHFDQNLVSVFTSELLFISYNEEQGQSSVNFENIKVGKRTSSSQKTEKFIGISLMKTNEQFSYICISSSGAMFKCCVTDNKSGSNLLMTEKTIQYLCRHCLTLCKDKNKQKEHISRNHLGPVKCPMCQMIIDDLKQLRSHRLTCSYPYGVPNCSLKHNRLAKAVNHHTKYLKSLKLNNFFVVK